MLAPQTVGNNKRTQVISLSGNPCDSVDDTYNYYMFRWLFSHVRRARRCVTIAKSTETEDSWKWLSPHAINQERASEEETK